jgi:ORF6N domain
VSATAKAGPAAGSADDAAVMLPRIENRIVVVRELKVIIDADLALLYGVPTKRQNEQVKRNAERFSRRDFMFALSAAEKAQVVANCDHLGKLKFSKSIPYAFTEHGAIQVANVLASPRAVEMGIYVVRAFVRLKAASASYAELAKRLDELEDKSEGLALSHDTFSRDTRAQLKQLFDALRALMAPPETPKRPIAFVTPREDKGKGAKSSGRK